MNLYWTMVILPSERENFNIANCATKTNQQKHPMQLKTNRAFICRMMCDFLCLNKILRLYYKSFCLNKILRLYYKYFCLNKILRLYYKSFCLNKILRLYYKSFFLNRILRLYYKSFCESVDERNRFAFP